MEDHVRKSYEDALENYRRMAATLKGDEKAYSERMIREIEEKLYNDNQK